MFHFKIIFPFFFLLLRVIRYRKWEKKIFNDLSCSLIEAKAKKYFFRLMSKSTFFNLNSIKARYTRGDVLLRGLIHLHRNDEWTNKKRERKHHNLAKDIWCWGWLFAFLINFVTIKCRKALSYVPLCINTFINVLRYHKTKNDAE